MKFLIQFKMIQQKQDWHITDKKVLGCYNKSYNKERH